MTATMKKPNEEEETTITLPAACFELPDNFDASLEGFFSDMQRRARDNFLHNGGIATTFCLLSERSDGKCLVTQVLCDWGSDMEKAAVMQVVKAMINTDYDDSGRLVKSFVYISEAWMSASGDKTVRPSKDPNRIEVVNLFARERGRPDCLHAMAEIKRHALSAKPSLDSWAVMGNAKMMFDMFDDDAAKTALH